MSTTARQNGKHPGGRPRTKSPAVITPEMRKRIEEMARDQCKDLTISGALGIADDTFKREFAEITHKQRCKGKIELHKLQTKRARNGSDTMLIWLGKQHLEQKDKQDIAHNGTVNLHVVSYRDAESAGFNPDGSAKSKTDLTKVPGNTG